MSGKSSTVGYDGEEHSVEGIETQISLYDFATDKTSTLLASVFSGEGTTTISFTYIISVSCF